MKAVVKSLGPRYQGGKRPFWAMMYYRLNGRWSNAYEAVELPDALSRIREEVQVAFGRNIRPVAPTAAEFDIFNGVYLPNVPQSVYVKADAGFLNIAGHELLHDLELRR